MLHQCLKILLILCMVAAACGTASAAVGVIAETKTTSSGSAVVCTAPCECISEAEAATRWGAEGYDRCSKSICGQSADAMVQYYCFHQIGGSSSSALPSGTPVAAASEASLQQTTLQTTAQTVLPVQTTLMPTAQVPATTAASGASPSPSFTWPAAGATPQQRSPVGIPTIVAAFGIALLVFGATKKE